jgi:hypothetical protein
MANPKQVEILRKGTVAWNTWRKENPQVQPDFYQATFHAPDLRGADLRGANFIEAWLYWPNLRNADLRDTNFRLAHLIEANLVEADLSGADLTATYLMKCNLVEANVEGSTLLACHIYGISTWKLRGEPKEQTNLVVTSPDEPIITVDNLEVAQLIYLLLNNKKIRDVIDTVARKVVLILGRFTPDRKAVLDAIREELRKRDYLPVLFDFDKPATRDITETMRTLAHLSRFVVADISDPSSIPLELQAVVPDLAVPVQPLLLSGQSEFSMFVDLRKKYHWVLATHQYTDIADLLASLGNKVIAPAEAKAKELEKR